MKSVKRAESQEDTRIAVTEANELTSGRSAAYNEDTLEANNAVTGIVDSIVQQSITDGEMLDAVKAVEEQLLATGEGTSQVNVEPAEKVSAVSPGNSKKSDLSMVFGPGASDLHLDQSTANLEVPTNFSPKTGSSTPLRDPSRGRRRTRNSGRSSLSSPTPVRPPN